MNREEIYGRKRFFFKVKCPRRPVENKLLDLRLTNRNGFERFESVEKFDTFNDRGSKLYTIQLNAIICE